MLILYLLHFLRYKRSNQSSRLFFFLRASLFSVDCDSHQYIIGVLYSLRKEILYEKRYIYFKWIENHCLYTLLLIFFNYTHISLQRPCLTLQTWFQALWLQDPNMSHIWSYRDFIICIYTICFFHYRHQRNNSTNIQNMSLKISSRR